MRQKKAWRDEEGNQAMFGDHDHGQGSRSGTGQSGTYAATDQTGTPQTGSNDIGTSQSSISRGQTGAASQAGTSAKTA